MIKNANQIYKKLKIISDEVRESLRARGIAIPLENTDGSITLGKYTVYKSDNFYQIKTHTGEVVIDQINLPHTAIIVANGLALGKFTNNTILSLDKNYGYAVFEEELHQKQALKSKDPDWSEMMLEKSRIKQQQKNQYKQAIVKSFEKLNKFS